MISTKMFRFKAFSRNRVIGAVPRSIRKDQNKPLWSLHMDTRSCYQFHAPQSSNIDILSLANTEENSKSSSGCIWDSPLKHPGATVITPTWDHNNQKVTCLTVSFGDKYEEDNASLLSVQCNVRHFQPQTVFFHENNKFQQLKLLMSSMGYDGYFYKTDGDLGTAYFYRR